MQTFMDSRMRQKRSKQLRRIAREISPNNWHKIYKSTKRELNNMPKAKRQEVGKILERVEIVE